MRICDWQFNEKCFSINQTKGERASISTHLKTTRACLGDFYVFLSFHRGTEKDRLMAALIRWIKPTMDNTSTFSGRLNPFLGVSVSTFPLLSLHARSSRGDYERLLKMRPWRHYLGNFNDDVSNAHSTKKGALIRAQTANACVPSILPNASIRWKLLFFSTL